VYSEDFDVCSEELDVCPDQVGRVSEQDMHFADVAFRNGAERGELLPIDHLWICNASLPSWPRVLQMRRLIPCIYLCTDHARELALPWDAPS
jgi:hypothetical protein